MPRTTPWDWRSRTRRVSSQDGARQLQRHPWCVTAGSGPSAPGTTNGQRESPACLNIWVWIAHANTSFKRKEFQLHKEKSLVSLWQVLTELQLFFHNGLHWRREGKMRIMFIFLYLTKSRTLQSIHQKRHLTGLNDV